MPYSSPETPVLNLPQSVTCSPTELCERLRALMTEIGGSLHSEEAQQRLVDWRVLAARVFAERTRMGEKDPELTTAQSLVRQIAEAGLADFSVPRELMVLAEQYASAGWSGVVAAMMLVPAWQWPSRPRLSAVPRWLMPLCADYLFTAPRVLTVPGQADAYTRCHLAALQDLATVTEANRSSRVALCGLESLRCAEAAPVLSLAPNLLPEISAAHSRLLAALTRGPRDPDFFGTLREGRKLRLAVVSRSLELSATSTSLLSLLERLDAARFEVTLYLQQLDQSPVVQQLTNRGATVMALPTETAAVVQILRDALLDVAIFVVDSRLWSLDPIVPLAAHRLAVLQLVHQASDTVLALREVDLVLRGEYAPSAAQTNGGPRIGLLPGLGALARCELQSGEDAMPWTRGEVGFAEDAFVCAAIADLCTITPETQEVWAAALARVPRVCLLIAPPVPSGQTDVPELDRFASGFSNRLRAAGVDVTRVQVVPFHRSVFEDLKQPLGIADVVLDVPAPGSGEVAIAALGAGLPVLALAASVPNPVVTLLERNGFSDWAVPAADAFSTRLGELAALDGEGREAMQTRVSGAGRALLAQHDSLAQSEAFAGLLEKAFDQIVESRRRFEKDRSPITNAVPDPKGVEDEARYFLDLNAPSDAEMRARMLLRCDPSSVEPRLLLAMAASFAGRGDEAMAVGVSAIELRPLDAAVWHEFAVIARRCWRPQDAIKALESALRLDEKRAESWRLLQEIATEAGDVSMQEEIATILTQLDSETPKSAEVVGASLS